MAYTTDPSTIPAYYHKRFVERLTPQLAMYDLAEKWPLAPNSGTVMYFPRMSASSTTVSAYKSTAGTLVTPEAANDVRVSATLEKFRNAKAIWDVVKLTALSTYVDAVVDEQADHAATIVDKRILEEAYGTSSYPRNQGFSVQYADLSTGDWLEASAAPTYIGTSKTITAAMIRKWVGILRARNVRELDSTGLFALVVHTNTEMAMQADSTIQAAMGLYTDPEKMRKGLVGSYAGVEVRRDNNVYSSALGSSGATLYYSVLLGKGALGVSELNGGITTIVKESGAQDTYNPVNEFVTFGWKVMFVPKILNVSCGLICVTSD